MGKIATTDGDNTIFRNIPTGLYYYYIPADAKGIMNYGQYLGNNPSILSVTYSPFADNDVVTYTEVDYDNERFKDSNNTIKYTQHSSSTQSTVYKVYSSSMNVKFYNWNN